MSKLEVTVTSRLVGTTMEEGPSSMVQPCINLYWERCVGSEKSRCGLDVSNSRHIPCSSSGEYVILMMSKLNLRGKKNMAAVHVRAVSGVIHEPQSVMSDLHANI